MEPPPPPLPSRSNSPRRKRPLWGFACLALLPLAGGLLLLGGHPHPLAWPPSFLRHRESAPAEPQFSSAPTPTGNAALKDLHFQPVEFSGPPAFVPRLRVAYRDKILTITDQGKNGDVGAVKGPEAVVWTAPVALTAFIQETKAGVHILRNGGYRVLWSDVADVAKPDLLFDKTRDGRARLTGKGGVLLWAGHLPPTRFGSQDSRIQGDQVSITTPSVQVQGAGGVFRVSAGALLWSGHLPPSPLIVLRDERSLVVERAGGDQSGPDESLRVNVEGASETVTIADAQGRTLGTRAVDALTVHHTTLFGTLPPDVPWPVDYKSQDGRLDAVGTLLLTYRDAAGRVVRRSKVYRDTHGVSGCLG